MFSRSDVIFPCMADTEETHHIITDALLGRMKRDAFFVSVVHKYYNHALLLERVAGGSLAGYGFEAEPGSFFAHAGNVWAAPAYAWCTEGSMRRAMDFFVQAIADAAEGRFPNRVNA